MIRAKPMKIAVLFFYRKLSYRHGGFRQRAKKYLKIS